MVVTQKLPVSTLPKVESRPEFAQDHESGLRSDRGPVVLCDFSKLRFWKSPYEFLNLYGRFCPYNPPYDPRHDTLSPNLHIKIFTSRKKIRRKSIEFRKPYRLTQRKPGLEISFRMQIWGQWVNKNDPSLTSEQTVLLTELKEKYCVYTDYLAPAKDPNCGSLSTIRVSVSWNLALEPSRPF